MMNINELLKTIINDFYDRDLPSIVSRKLSIKWIPQKANVIIGMRRVGKTWFCYQTILELLNKNINKNRILYINFEDDRLLDFNISHFQNILDIYYRKFPENKDKQCYFFLDEIQNIPNWEKFIRRVLDTEKIEICLTGSSAKLLSTEIATSLRGRSLTTEIFPYSFKEFLFLENKKNILEKNIDNLSSKELAIIKNLYDKYYIIGGFPEVQNHEKTIRNEILRSYIDVVMLRDVIERYNVKNIVSLRALIKQVLHNPGTKFSVNKFFNHLKAQQIACTKNDLYLYLDYLSDAFLIYLIPIHSRSIKKRQVNPKKIYIIDHGLIQAMSLEMTNDKGSILENIVFMHLRRLTSQIEYYITKNSYEVDFIVNTESNNKLIIQVCADTSHKDTLERETRSIKEAQKELNINQGIIITHDQEGELENNIKLIPIYKWLLFPTLGNVHKW